MPKSIPGASDVRLSFASIQQVGQGRIHQSSSFCCEVLKKLIQRCMK